MSRERGSKLDPGALAYVSAAICGAGVLVIGLIHLWDPTYGVEFLQLLASVYPGYTVEQTVDSVLVGVGYAVVKGAVVGWLFGWLYNRLVK